MEFGINWRDGGYVVCVLISDNNGYKRWYPLRNFGIYQGEARCFKEFDCPTLNDFMLKMLIKQYNPKIIWRRIKSGKFVRNENF